MNRLIYRLKNLMEERTLSQAYICRATGLSNTVLSRWLSNTYEGDVQKVCNLIESFLQRESEKYSTRKLDFMMTSVARKVFEVARIAHIDCEIGVCYGQAGLGKTQAVKEYASLNPDVILIEADLGYTTRVLFSEIHKKLGLDGGGMIHSLLEDIIAKLKNSGRLIIVDEAEHLPYRALELIRRIHDKANIGILLVGMPKLVANLRGKRGQYEQLYSRIGVAGRLNTLRPEDTETIVNSVIKEDPKIWKSFHEASLGNTRVLTKLLMRSTRVAQINSVSVDSHIVQETAKMLIV
jgi:DNA transposition AAA+ family ATPase